MPPPSRVPCMDARRLARDDTIQKLSRAYDRRVEAGCAPIGMRSYYACTVLGKRGKLQGEVFSLEGMDLAISKAMLIASVRHWHCVGTAQKPSRVTMDMRIKSKLLQEQEATQTAAAKHQIKIGKPVTEADRIKWDQEDSSSGEGQTVADLKATIEKESANIDTTLTSRLASLCHSLRGKQHPLMDRGPKVRHDLGLRL